MAQSVQDLWGYLHGYLQAQSLMAGCRLRVFDELENTSKTMSDLALTIGAPEDATERLLCALVSLGVLSRTTVDSGKSADRISDLFTNTSLANNYLTSTSPLSLRPCVLVADKYLYGLTAHLTSAVREGAPQTERVSSAFSKSASKDSDKRLMLVGAMHAKLTVFYREAATSSFDLSPYKSGCNLGGGTGALAYAIAAAYSEMNIVVYDIPSVVEIVSQFTPYDPYTPMVNFKAGNFFKGYLPEVQLYVLADIFPKLSDQQTEELLRRVFDALTPGGAVLILDCFYDDKKCGPQSASLMDLLLLLSSPERCRHRSTHELGELLREIGFVDREVANTSSQLTAMMASKPHNSVIENTLMSFDNISERNHYVTSKPQDEV
ncbi:acetylserotonin O-methyltransferase-like [Glandiceps talaboti]